MLEKKTHILQIKNTSNVVMKKRISFTNKISNNVIMVIM